MYYGTRRAWYDPALNFCANAHLSNPATISPHGLDTAERVRRCAEMIGRVRGERIDWVERLKQGMSQAVEST
jgi:hypothetical protein